MILRSEESEEIMSPRFEVVVSEVPIRHTAQSHFMTYHLLALIISMSEVLTDANNTKKTWKRVAIVSRHARPERHSLGVIGIQPLRAD